MIKRRNLRWPIRLRRRVRCPGISRGTQRGFPLKRIENIFQAIQSTFRSLEMYSKWH